MINGVNLPKMPLQLLGDIVDKAKVKQVNSVIEGPGITLGWVQPFCEKTINVLLKWTLFLAGPHIQAIVL